MNPAMCLERRRLSERLAAGLAAVGPRALVAAHVGDEGGFVPEPVGAYVAGERPLAGVSRQVVAEVNPGADGSKLFISASPTIGGNKLERIQMRHSKGSSLSITTCRGQTR
jgi:hypothetical protein